MTRSVFAFVVALLLAETGMALTTGSPWGGIAPKFLDENQFFRAQTQENQSWDGWLCEGSYSYKLFFESRLRDVNIDVTTPKSWVVDADFESIAAKAQGGYQSKATLCVPTAGWLGVTIGWARLRTEVHFNSQNVRDFRLKILSTELGDINLGRYFPQWFENFFTGVLNRGLSMVWNSRLGNWISGKITEVAKSKIPDNGR